MKKSYLDANVLVSIIRGKNKEPTNYEFATKILNDIKSGKTLAIISSLTLMEIFFVLKTINGTNEANLGGESKEGQIEFVNNETKIMYDRLLSILLKLPNIKFDEGNNIDSKKLFDVGINMMKNIRGKVKFRNDCKKCGAGNKRFYNYKGAGVDDILHVLLAKDMKCDELITFDHDFEEFSNYDEIKPLSIMVYKR